MLCFKANVLFRPLHPSNGTMASFDLPDIDTILSEYSALGTGDTLVNPATADNAVCKPLDESDPRELAGSATDNHQAAESTTPSPTGPPRPPALCPSTLTSAEIPEVMLPESATPLRSQLPPSTHSSAGIPLLVLPSGGPGGAYMPGPFNNTSVSTLATPATIMGMHRTLVDMVQDPRHLDDLLAAGRNNHGSMEILDNDAQLGNNEQNSKGEYKDNGVFSELEEDYSGFHEYDEEEAMDWETDEELNCGTRILLGNDLPAEDRTMTQTNSPLPRRDNAAALMSPPQWPASATRNANTKLLHSGEQQTRGCSISYSSRSKILNYTRSVRPSWTASRLRRLRKFAVRTTRSIMYSEKYHTKINEIAHAMGVDRQFLSEIMVLQSHSEEEWNVKEEDVDRKIPEGWSATASDRRREYGQPAYNGH